MKTQCPNCTDCFDIPDVYKGRNITCFNCKHDFPASKHIVVLGPQEPAATSDWRLSLPSSNSLGYMAAIGAFVSVIAICGCVIDGSGIECAVSFVALLLSLVLGGIGKLVDAVNANTLRHEKKL